MPHAALPISPAAPWLAPLAGFSDLPFRLWGRERGAAVCVTEMVSAKSLIYDNPAACDLLASTPADAPLAVQLFGADETSVVKAVSRLLDMGFAYFDLNAGCPVRKVVKTGAGAALLATPDVLVDLAKAMTRLAGPGRVGVKLRLGVRPGQEVLWELMPRLEEAGVAWLAIHPRHASQGFSGTADKAAFAALRSRTGLPLIYSGDLFCASDALACLEETRADAVMFARGALADPGIFTRFAALARGEIIAPPDAAEIAATARRYAELSRAHANAHTALLKMRTVIPRFARGLPGSRALRARLSSCTSWEQLETLIASIETSQSNADDATI